MARLTDIRLSTAVLLVQVFVKMLQLSSLGPQWMSTLERHLLRVNSVITGVGFLVLLLFYRHISLAIANRNPVWQAKPIFEIYLLIKPLEIVFRLMTAPLRCLPDVCLIGQVRCGTTTLSEHMKSLPGVHGPFCAFDHVLDGKESFYFVGHYFGFVHPYFYRAMFPFKTTRWFHKQVLGRQFIVYDGCAQYLSAPWVPAMMREAVGPDLRIFVCLREPVSHCLSWWRYEHAAMGWWDSMGVSGTTYGSQANVPNAKQQHRHLYPPRNFSEAITLSESATVSKWYEEAASAKTSQAWILPMKFITWPNGQLSAATRSGDFHQHLQRWFLMFDKNKFEYFEVTELTSDLKGVHDRIVGALPPHYDTTAIPKFSGNRKVIVTNQSQQLSKELEPMLIELQALAKFYKNKNLDLFKLIGRSYPHWQRTKYYNEP
eukprot:m.63583 g.63583  ORF g.63583 m.63583 type:complete len:430 (+) comp23305_c2_seq1:68-1357(+)